MMGIPFYDLAGLHDELANEIDSAIRRVVSSNCFVLGPECDAFEREFATYCGADHAVGVGTGLDALRLGITALGIGPGDEVIVPGQTFIATWLAVSASGATPVPVDVSESTGQIDSHAVAAAITPATAAVVAVHLFGGMAPVRELAALCRKHGIALVEDAAQAHGAQTAGQRAGSWSDVSAFSFYPGKNLGAMGDGGMVVTSRTDVAEKVRLLRNYGSRNKYVHEVVGENSRLDEVQAAILRVKLPYLDAWNTRRRSIAEHYERLLAGVTGIRTVAAEADSLSAHHLFPIKVAERDAVRGALARAGIETGVHYPSLPSWSGAYSADYGACHLPHSAELARHEVSLPMGPSMRFSEVEEIVQRLIDLHSGELRDTVLEMAER